MMVIKGKITGLLTFMFIFGFAMQAQACTLFSAAGNEWVKGGGTLIAKNRDASPSVQELKVVTPVDGYRYYGIFVDSQFGYLRGGVNEKGLAVVCATASSISDERRKELGSYKDEYGRSDEYIISKCATVDEALQLDKRIWAGAQYIMLADKNKIACVEIGPDGNLSVKETMNGELHHTNHYVNDEMLWANELVPSAGSTTRYDRIGKLLNESARPFTLEDFVAFGHDKNAGTNDSIWRDGLSEKASQTLGWFAVHIPPTGSPMLYVEMRRNPSEKGKEEVYKLDFEQIFKK